MTIDTRINALVVQEFRLHSADTAGDAAGIVAAFSHGIGPAVPLLTSIDDNRDVATVRALHPGEGTEDDPAQWFWFEGNFADYETNKVARLGEEAARPHAMTHRRLTRD